MKFSFEELYIWKQNALSLISLGKYSLGLGVLKEVIRLDPKSIDNYLLAAKICYQYLNIPQEGLKHARDAILKDLENSSGFLGRSYMYAGIGYHLLAEASLLKKDKDELRFKALSQFRRYNNLLLLFWHKIIYNQYFFTVLLILNQMTICADIILGFY